MLPTCTSPHVLPVSSPAQAVARADPAFNKAILKNLAQAEAMLPADLLQRGVLRLCNSPGLVAQTSRRTRQGYEEPEKLYLS